MIAADRRSSILKSLESSKKPVNATTLAKEYNVSRQIIVGDIALLRAAGAAITATPHGYVLGEGSGVSYTIACCHNSEQMRDELYCIVDNGCIVSDVIVEHPIYGQLSGKLELASRYDVDTFIQKCSKDDALPLSVLTAGIHLHNVRCPDEAAYQRICVQLSAMGILLESSEL